MLIGLLIEIAERGEVTVLVGLMEMVVEMVCLGM
jgi:hypothetical protein